MMIEKPKTETWKKFIKNWSRITSPGRPTKKETEIYRKFGLLRLKKKGTKVLVLGSTPEIRDMLAKHKNIQVYLIDINIDNSFAMSELMKNRKAKEKEVWMKANWLTAPLPENYFDLIYGDFVVCNIPFKKQDKFLINIKTWLKKNGLFITRCETIKPEYKNLSFEKFCCLFENKPVNLKTINHFWELGVYLGEIGKENRFSPGVFYKHLRDYLEKYPNKNVEKILKTGGILYPLEWTWSLCMEKRIKSLFSRHFTIKREEFDPKINFFYPDWYPIYCLKPKK